MDLFALHICHLHSLRAPNPKHVLLLLIPMFKWFPIDLENYMTLKHNISQTSVIGIFYLDMCCGCKSMWKVHSCGTATSNCIASPKLTKTNSFKIRELIWVGIFAPLLNIGYIMSFGDDLSGGSIKTPILR